MRVYMHICVHMYLYVYKDRERNKVAYRESICTQRTGNGPEYLWSIVKRERMRSGEEAKRVEADCRVSFKTSKALFVKEKPLKHFKHGNDVICCCCC